MASAPPLCLVILAVGFSHGCDEAPSRSGDPALTEAGVWVEGPPRSDASAPEKLDAPPARHDVKGPASPDKTVAPRPDTASPNALTAVENDLFKAINTYRQGRSLSTLTIDSTLLCAARDAVLYCCSPQCHHYNCADGTAQPGDRVIKCGGSLAVAQKSSELGAGPGFASGAQVVSAWAGDPPHADILNRPEATTVGVGGSSAGCYFAVFNVYPPSS
jgi:uncharacterized protein YkwD